MTSKPKPAKPAEYTVTSTRLSGHDQGDTVTVTELVAGNKRVNVAALVAGGHIKPKPTTSKPQPKEA